VLDADSKLVVSLVVGRRTTETAVQAFVDFYRRTDGQLPPLIATDEYAVYPTVLVSVYGVHKEDMEPSEAERATRTWQEWPDIYFPVEISFVTVHKERSQGRVTKVEPRVVFGTAEQVGETLAQGTSSPTINTSYVERWNGTQRHQNARKTRKTCTFSKELLFHAAVTCLCVFFYNFGWTVRTLRERVQQEPPRYRPRTPAMAAGLADHVWTLNEILTRPVYPSNDPLRDIICPELGHSGAEGQ